MAEQTLYEQLAKQKNIILSSEKKELEQFFEVSTVTRDFVSEGKEPKQIQEISVRLKNDQKTTVFLTPTNGSQIRMPLPLIRDNPITFSMSQCLSEGFYDVYQDQTEKRILASRRFVGEERLLTIEVVKEFTGFFYITVTFENYRTEKDDALVLIRRGVVERITRFNDPDVKKLSLKYNDLVVGVEYTVLLVKKQEILNVHIGDKVWNFMFIGMQKFCVNSCDDDSIENENKNDENEEEPLFDKIEKVPETHEQPNTDKKDGPKKPENKVVII
ncbi:hypothetical protein EIN_052710 [Entamoeba invadens IP1]|uniref:hypothetical protein n=1 Tax=Entamoeba invadens IP1 TaxID=370355 RepID=UPI0002C3D860|nr:hypothetical protein EIN_052710 [Entamoeba invadens IP1]ELP93056.1 hypothetical protein EIN_052710 [Entamoeba invadens IP1]|eukprot:XP_004259827.1 hypothetical protein EIN_052710 [Entamoeba invadens IP1]